jgi:hypothetical protein
MDSHLSRVCRSKPYDPNPIFARRIDQNMHPSLQEPDRDKAGFPIAATHVGPDHRGTPVKVSRTRQRNAVLGSIARVLARVELDVWHLL